MSKTIETEEQRRVCLMALFRKLALEPFSSFFEPRTVRISNVFEYMMRRFREIVRITIRVPSQYIAKAVSGAKVVYEFAKNLCFVVWSLIFTGFPVQTSIFHSGPLLIAGWFNFTIKAWNKGKSSPMDGDCILQAIFNCTWGISVYPDQPAGPILTVRLLFTPFWAGMFCSKAEEGHHIQKNVVTNEEDAGKMDASVVVLLVSSSLQFQVFVNLFSNVRHAFKYY